MEELGPGGVSWFAPQNQGGGRRLKTPSRGGMGVGLGTDGGDGRRQRLGPRCGRGGDGRRHIIAEVSNLLGKITDPMTIMIRVAELMAGCF